MNGVGHKTSIQIAQEQGRTYSTSTVAGRKRSLPDAKPEGTRPPSSGQRAVFQRARTLPSIGKPNLTASGITPLVHCESEYSQRRAFPSTPTAATDPLLSLSNPAYGLHEHLAANIQACGIKSIYPWQKSCLLGPGLLSGDKNLVYSAPTGGGKSLVADGRTSGPVLSVTDLCSADAEARLGG